MKLPVNVRVKRGILAVIPWVSDNVAHAIYPNIYLPRKYFDDLNHRNSDPKNIAILVHEQTHIERQKKRGWLKWGIKYLLFPKFRFNEELIATKAQMVVFKKYKRDFDIEKGAKSLSGWLYFWPVAYEMAKRELEKIWGEI